MLDPAVMVPRIRDHVQTFAVDLPLVKIVPDQELQDCESGEERSLTRLVAGSGALAFGLTVLGLYGTVVYLVPQRMRELTIRFTLGTTQRGVQWMIMHEAMRYVFVGILVGGILSLGASRAVESFLFEVRGFDPAHMCLVDWVHDSHCLRGCVCAGATQSELSQWPYYETS